MPMTWDALTKASIPMTSDGLAQDAIPITRDAVARATAGEMVLPYDHSIVPQETGYWSGPAPTQVVLHATGISVPQSELARPNRTHPAAPGNALPLHPAPRPHPPPPPHPSHSN